MEKQFMNIKTMVLSMAAVALMASSMVSCTYDDTELRTEIENIKKELAELRESLQQELNAIKDLVNGLVTVKDVEQKNDGSKVITLSDGSKITVYPKGDTVPSNIITTTTVDGVLCWAYYDGLGNAQPVVVAGKYVPVAEIAPQTQINDGAIEVSFDGGNTWIVTGYSESVADSIIKDIEVVYSDWQTDAEGNPLPLYCVITFADGSVMKVGMQSGKIILPFDSLFVPYGAMMPFSIEIADVADYILLTPEGWECDVEHNAKQGRMVLNFVAPELEAINAGEAEASGIAKLMVVFNSGSSAIASIKLSTNPLTVYFAPKGVHLEAGYGNSYVLCGMSGAAQFDVDTIVNACTNVLGGASATGVYEVAFMESLSTYILYTELRSTALKANSEYVFWYVVPRSNENGDMYVVADEVCTEHYIHSTAKMTVTKKDFFDVTIDFEVLGSNGYMLGYTTADEFDAQALADYYTEYPDYLNAVHQDMEYEGSFLALFDPNVLRLTEGTDYVAYYIAKPKNGVVLADHVVNWKFTTKPFVEGGSLKVTTIGDAVIDYDSIELTLDSDNEHIAFFYNAMPSYMASSYSDDSLAIEMLTTEGQKVVSGDAVVARYEGAKAGDKLTFFAVAVDKNGKYGEVFKQEYTTRKIVYSPLSLTATLVDYKIDNTRVLVECEGAVAYRYVYTRTDDETVWTKRYGGTVKKAGEYMIKNLTASDVYNTATEKYALVDGHICLSGLDMGEEYVIVVAGVDADGLLTEPQACYFSPIANIGTVVTRDKTEWEVGKPTINILNYEDNPHLFYQFTWTFVPGEHTTAYSAAMFPENFVNEYLGTNIDTVEKLIADIITSCDTGTMSEQGKSCTWNEEGLYLREWDEYEDLDDDGFMEVVHKSEYLPYCYHHYPYGTAEKTFIYTTWVGEDGNFHEPYAIDAMTGKEVDIWTGAFIE